MKQFFKEYFTFNRREQRGILVLLGIIIALLISFIVLKNTSANQQYDFSAFEKEIAALEQETPKDSVGMVALETNKEQHHHKNRIPNTNKERFYFNPNNLPELGWERLGFSDKQIKTIKNYEKKGGKFYKKEDLKKIYGIPEVLYLSVEPYIQLSNQAVVFKNVNHATANQQHQPANTPLELNSADSAQLLALKGVGPAFASRILKYRNKLGGFIGINQLKEVYGIDSTLYALIAKQIIVDSSKIEKIDINKITVEQLKNHPYIKYKTAGLIINYRNKHGLYQSASELKNIDALSDSVLNKIKPYLTTY